MAKKPNVECEKHNTGNIWEDAAIQMVKDNSRDQTSKISVFHVEAENVSEEAVKVILDTLSCHLMGIDRIR